jgi:hypothetical protein
MKADDLVWVDQAKYREGARKRHIYAEVSPSSVEGRVYKRVCGAGNPSDPDTVRGKKRLTRVSAAHIAADPELCKNCQKIRGLDSVTSGSRGAESVSYDPFGVFDS